MSELLTWQIVDSAFPTGVFSHSWGLEAAWQSGEIATLDELRAFVDASILQAGHACLPFMNDVYRDPDSLVTLDAIADAFLVNSVANRASRMQGRTLVATAARVWPSERLTHIQSRAAATCAHVGPLSGVVFRAIGLPLATAQRVVLYGTARGVLSAAVRLGIVGSFEAQRLQFASGPRLEQIAAQCSWSSIDDLAQTSPIADLLQAGHDRLYSRLFQS